MEKLRELCLRAFEILRPFHKHFGNVLLFLLVIEMLAIASPYLLGKVINGMQAQLPVGNILVLLIITGVLMLVSVFIQNRKDQYELRNIDYSVSTYLTDQTLSKTLGLSIGQHRSQNSGITQSVVSQGQSSLSQLVNLVLFNIAPAVARIVFTTIAILWFNWMVGLVVLALTMGNVWYSVFLNKRFWRKIKNHNDLSHRNSKRHREIMGNMSLVQVNSQENRVRKEHQQRLDQYASEGQGIWIPYVGFATYRQAGVVLIRMAVIFIGVFLVYYRGYQFGDFVTLVFWTNQATSELSTVGHYQRQWMNLSAPVLKYFAILDVEPAVKSIPNPVIPQHIEGRIEFRDVSFTYPNIRYIEVDEDKENQEEAQTHEPALKDVSFVIEAGQRVAFVGESGAGKSSIVNLLVRGYDPDHGQIMVDDNDLRLLDLTHFRRTLGLVEQNVLLFDGTMRYNTLFGLNGTGDSVTDAELDKLSKEACIDRFSHRLVNGWETRIGENGVKLSGGERQRVGIARALIKDPRILILDEATSSLDAVNESLIKEAVHNASAGRTTIIIAHRLSTVRDVDKIFVMDKGRVVGEGTHAELMESSAQYRELVNKQLFSL